MYFLWNTIVLCLWKLVTSINVHKIQCLWKALYAKMMIFDWSVTIIVLYGYILIGFSSYIVVAYLDNFDTCLSNN